MEITYREYMLSINSEEQYVRPEFTKEFVARNFEIDYDYEPYEGLCYLNLALIDYSTLNEIADHIRMEECMIPFFTEDAEGRTQTDSWYNFYIAFYDDGKVGLSFVVDACNRNIEDDGKEYDIELTETEMENIFESLKDEIKSHCYYEITKENGMYKWREIDDC